MVICNCSPQAGVETGDRVWRMPLLKHYSTQMTKSDLADVNNIGTHSREGGACTAAAFLTVAVYVHRAHASSDK